MRRVDDHRLFIRLGSWAAFQTETGRNVAPRLRPEVGGVSHRVRACAMTPRACRIRALKFGVLMLAGAGSPVFGEVASSAKPSLSFSAAWERVKLKNEGLLASHEEVKQAEAGYDATRSLYLPQIDFVSQWTRLDSAIAFDLAPLRPLLAASSPSVSLPPVALRVPVQDRSFLKATVQASYPIWTGGRISAARKVSALALDSARSVQRRQENTTFTELVRRYYGYQLAAIVRRTRAEARVSYEEHARQARALEAQGQTARVETLQAEASRTDAQREFQNAVRQEEIAGIALAQLLLLDYSPRPESPLFVTHEGLPPVGELAALAKSQNPVLQQLVAQQAQAGQALLAEKARLQPEVYLFGRRELNPSDLTTTDPTWAAGIGVNFPLLDRSDRLARMRRARSQAQRVEYLQSDAERSVHTLVEKTLREVINSLEQYDAYGPTLALAQEVLRLRRLGFTESLYTSLDVVDAQVNLTRVETGQAKAAYDYIVSLATLFEATGNPGEFHRYEKNADVRVKP